MPLPKDFEKLVKLPDADGYPYSIKSEDLMKNFAWCDLLPSDANDSIRIELDEVPGKTAQHQQRRLRVVSGGGVGSGGGSNHPWKVTSDGSNSWTALGGIVYSQVLPITVDEITGSDVLGYIVLRIARNSTTRLTTGADLIFENNVSTSTKSNQYRAIAYIGESASDITQLQFEEIRIYEELVVENGSFVLQGYDISHRNNYSPV